MRGVCTGGGSATAAAQPSAATEEQRLKQQKRAAKALRKQQWDAQQAEQAAQDAAAGPASNADADEEAEDADGAAEPEVHRRKKSHKAASTSDVVRRLRVSCLPRVCRHVPSTQARVGNARRSEPRAAGIGQQNSGATQAAGCARYTAACPQANAEQCKKRSPESFQWQ